MKVSGPIGAAGGQNPPASKQLWKPHPGGSAEHLLCAHMLGLQSRGEGRWHSACDRIGKKPGIYLQILADFSPPRPTGMEHGQGGGLSPGRFLGGGSPPRGQCCVSGTVEAGGREQGQGCRDSHTCPPSHPPPKERPQGGEGSQGH